MGNQFGLFSLTGQGDAPLVMMGSHLDSQSRAGRLDGTYGVAAALRVGAGLMRARRAGARFTADFCAVNWTNEEGARFRPSLLGSGTYLGRHTVAEALACRDDDGISLRRGPGGHRPGGRDAPPPRPACYLEIHVEQGTALEEAGRTIGIVTRNWGATKIEAVFTGVQAHTGPGRMERRRDALLAAAYAIADIRALADAWPGLLYTAVGRVQVAPNSANVVAGTRRDLGGAPIRRRRHPDARPEAGPTGSCAGAADRAGTGLTITSRGERPIRAMPEAVCDLVAACAEAQGLGALRMDTVAGHDALSFLGICPTGLVFVPSIDGIAHNEAEATDPADLAAGLALMRDAAERLCRRGGDPVRAAQPEPDRNEAARTRTSRRESPPPWRRLPGWEAGTAQIALAAAPVASPTHRAVASDCARVRRDGADPVFLKRRHADMAADLRPAMAEATRRAGALGLGPALLAEAGRGRRWSFWPTCPSPGATPGSATCRTPDTMAQVLGALRRLHGPEPLGQTFCPFERIAALAEEARACAAPVPDDIDALLADAELIRAAIAAAGFDRALLPQRRHRLEPHARAPKASGLAPDGVRLVDFDLAGRLRPLVRGRRAPQRGHRVRPRAPAGHRVLCRALRRGPVRPLPPLRRGGRPDVGPVGDHPGGDVAPARHRVLQVRPVAAAARAHHPGGARFRALAAPAVSGTGAGGDR